MIAAIKKLLVKSGGKLTPMAKEQMAKGLKEKKISPSQLDDLKALSVRLKKHEKAQAVKGTAKMQSKGFTEAGKAATAAKGKTPANELPTTNGLAADIPDDSFTSVAMDDLVKGMHGKKKAASLKTDSYYKKAASKGGDIGEKFLRNKKAQTRLLEVRMKKNEKLASLVKENGGSGEFLNSKLGESWIKKILKQKGR